MPVMKRFYQHVEIYEEANKFGLKLDGRPVKTQKSHLLLCPSRHIAEAAKEEWQRQEKEILPDTMPVTQIITTALDEVRSRQQALEHIISYAETDLVYFRSDTSPYKEKQEELWGQAVSWFEARFLLKLIITDQLAPISQDAKIKEYISDFCASLGALELTIYEVLLEDTSSNILTMAFFEKKLTSDEMFQAIFLDDLIRAEIYDEEKYGAAPDQEKKRKTVLRNLQAAEMLIADLRF